MNQNILISSFIATWTSSCLGFYINPKFWILDKLIIVKQLWRLKNMGGWNCAQKTKIRTDNTKGKNLKAY